MISNEVQKQPATSEEGVAGDETEEELFVRKMLEERARINATEASPPLTDPKRHLNFFPQEGATKTSATSVETTNIMEANTSKFATNMAVTEHIPIVTAQQEAVAVTSITVAGEVAEEAQAGPASTTKPQFELISGLMVALSEDAEINLSNDGFISVRTKNASLGDHFISAQGLCLQGRIAGSEVQDLVVSMEGMVLDPLATRETLVEFLGRFGLPKVPEKQESSDPRKGRMTQEEWEEFLSNAQTNTTPGCATLIPLDDIQTVDANGLCQKLDLKIPNAQVKAVQCQLPSHSSNMDFPDCKGAGGATVRTLLEYYFRSILDKMDLLSGRKADVSISAVASDVASVKASMIGASVGTVLLGPAGFVAGSYLGNRWMRQSSSVVNGGAAGLILFGPVGLVAGAVATDGQETRPQPKNNSTIVDQSGQTQRKSVVAATADHVAANKYEYAGSTGVYAGALAGMAVAGPIGLVAGSVVGSLSARKLVESTSSTAESKEAGENDKTETGYRFGDFTRGIVARGKETRSADTNEGYRFGDFTRGLFG